MANPNYSIVIPVYNSTSSLEELCKQIDRVFAEQACPYEILFIDDCSPNPKTWEILKQLPEKYPAVVVKLTRNFGQQAATLCGFTLARGDSIITMDDDLQHRPEDIPRLMDYRDHDIVIGQFKTKQVGAAKKFYSFIKSLFDRIILKKPKGLSLTSFRMIRKKIAMSMLSVQTPNPILGAMMFHVTRDIIGVEVTHMPRSEGQSNYTFYKGWKLFTNLLVNNSSLLLKTIGVMGFVCSLVSMFMTVFFVIKKVCFGTRAIGWTSMITAVFFLNGLLLFSVGVIGEYLLRIIQSIEKQSLFFVDEVIRPADQQEGDCPGVSER